jgi:hypothetical protein
MLISAGMLLHLMFIQDNSAHAPYQLMIGFFGFIIGAVWKAFYDDAQIGDNSMKLAVLVWALVSYKTISILLLAGLAMLALWFRGEL